MKKHAILLLLACCAQLSDLYAVGLKNLKVEYASCPLGVDVSRPRFSWQMSAGGERGVKQVAYRLQVYDEAGSCVWDSGETRSGVSLNIEYAGKPLEPETRYEWEVCVWTQKNDSVSASSWFETGLMAQNDADEAWDGAQWIGGGDEDMPLYSHYLPVFRLDYAFRFGEDSGALKTAFVYGANDERLMDADKNLFGLANGRDESYVRVEIDAGYPCRRERGGNPDISRGLLSGGQGGRAVADVRRPEELSERGEPVRGAYAESDFGIGIHPLLLRRKGGQDRRGESESSGAGRRLHRLSRGGRRGILPGGREAARGGKAGNPQLPHSVQRAAHRRGGRMDGHRRPRPQLYAHAAHNLLDRGEQGCKGASVCHRARHL